MMGFMPCILYSQPKAAKDDACHGLAAVVGFSKCVRPRAVSEKSRPVFKLLNSTTNIVCAYKQGDIGGSMMHTC